MFDFQKEVILNSLTLEDGTPRIKGENGVFRVLRCADYKKEYVDGKVMMTEGKAGAYTTATLAAPTEAGDYRVVIGVSLVGKYMADYAMPWSKFAKGIIAEFIATKDAEADDETNAKANAEAMVKAIKLALPENYKIINVKADDTNVVITGADYAQVINSVELSKMEASACVDGCSEVEYTAVATAAVTPNELPVGTGEWLIENLRFPTGANTGYYASNAEEAPVKGAKYDQYTFGYAVPRRGLGGQGTVGQALVSYTTHTFYALQGEVSDAVKQALLDAGFEIESISNHVEAATGTTIHETEVVTAAVNTPGEGEE